jgi:4-hydroxybenzoate polyprenyltransferase
MVETERDLATKLAAPPARSITSLVVALRPQQWTKNLVVYAAPFFGLRFDPASFWLGTAAFAAFTAASSAMYLVNDLVDQAADREHPVKRLRPIAAGALAPAVAVLTAGICLVAALVLAFAVAPLLGLTIIVYVLLQAGYNLGLRREPIIDIMVISGGFVLRALGGAAATRVPPSGWFLLCLWLLALYLAIEKRKAELRVVGDGGITRRVLRVYSLPWLLRMEGVVTASTIMSYALWAIGRTRTVWMLLTVPFVVYGLFRYQMEAEEGGESPEWILLRSRHLIAVIALWIVSTAAILILVDHGWPAARWIPG